MRQAEHRLRRGVLQARRRTATKGVGAILASRGKGTSFLVVVGASQTAIGYAQYALGLPVPLVAIHVAGSIAAWLAILGLWAAAGPGGPTGSVGDASRVVD